MSNNTPKVKKLNRKSLIVAIDIGKSAHYGYFRAPDGTDIKPFVFYNTRKSFEQFWHKVRRFANTHGLKKIVIGFESTGPYAEPLFNYLGDKPAQLVQINPMHTKRIKDLTGNSPNKTDQKDPRVIADVIGLGHALTLVVPQGPAAQLRRLTQARERSIKKRTAALGLNTANKRCCWRSRILSAKLNRKIALLINLKPRCSIICGKCPTVIICSRSRAWPQ